MNIQIKEVEIPQSSSFTVGAKLDVDLLYETKTIRVKPEFESKTIVSTDLSLGDWRAGINWQSDNFKQVRKVENNFLTGSVDEVYYFKYLKSQGKEQYYEYLKEVVSLYIERIKKQYNIELDSLTLEVEKRLN